jgi:hypothetical protein
LQYGFFVLEIVESSKIKITDEVINNLSISKLFSFQQIFKLKPAIKNTLTFLKKEKWIDWLSSCNANFSLKIKSLFFGFSLPYYFVF